MPTELNLRDIVLADSVSAWPPALGWWLLLALLLLITGLGWWFYRRYQQAALKRVALAEFARLRGRFESDALLPPLVAELSIFLRRVCLSLPAYQAEACAGVQGEAWLRFLDEALGGREFQQGAGRLLLQAPYAAQIDPKSDVHGLLQLVQCWLLVLPWTKKEPS
ncbi:MAG: DUF4381 domain-containing protein [Gammaproteobacteria bacterium]|nr:DUF4381 domain-containing protein [Gammaproteobacteria bacterium]